MSTDRDEIQRIEGLIDKYLSGGTNGLEEAALRDFFAKRPAEDIPVEWQPLKAMFAFVDDEREQLGRQPVGQRSRSSTVCCCVPCSTLAMIQRR